MFTLTAACFKTFFHLPSMHCSRGTLCHISEKYHHDTDVPMMHTRVMHRKKVPLEHTVLSFRFLCGSVKFMHCAGFLLLCMTTFTPRTIENLKVHKLTLTHKNLKLKSVWWEMVKKFRKDCNTWKYFSDLWVFSKENSTTSLTFFHISHNASRNVPQSSVKISLY